jgi:hypothetical protein
MSQKPTFTLQVSVGTLGSLRRSLVLTIAFAGEVLSQRDHLR